MKQFLKFFLASCLGVIVASLVLSFLGFMIMLGIAGSAEEVPAVTANSILKVKLDNPIPERTNNLQISPFDIENQYVLGLTEIVKSIEAAADDDDIQGIYLDLASGGGGIVSASVIREALVKFKESGKFIIAYSKYYSQGTYYLASTADKVYLNPLGGVDFHGFSGVVPFFKGTMDKLGLKMEVFYAGKYKSATEPYRRYDMSKEAKDQMREYLEPAYNQFLGNIGISRNKTVAELRAMAEDLKIQTTEDAINHGLVDEAAYVDQVIVELKDRLGFEASDKLKFVSVENYHSNAVKGKGNSGKDKIAVIYAEGAIIVGNGEPGNIGDDKYVKIIRKAREDKRVKAIVFRVSSPGGNPLASENIWREMELAKKAGKPVIVSMGNYAASGGYYISCMADSIVAEPNTLTGSIGVFLTLPNARGLLQDNLGMNFDTVKTTRNSVGLTGFFDLTEEERQYLDGMTKNYYEIFLDRVAKGRNMTRDEVHEVAQGRVWTGTKAKEVGLVDKIGGLEDAIQMAANMTGLEKYRLSEYPKVKDPIQQFLDEFMNKDESIKAELFKSELGEFYPYYKNYKEIMDAKGVQARLPFIIDYK